MHYVCEVAFFFLLDAEDAGIFGKRKCSMIIWKHNEVKDCRRAINRTYLSIFGYTLVIRA